MRYEIDDQTLTASIPQLIALKVLRNILIFYFLTLVFLPPLQGCTNVNAITGNKNSSHSSLPCSPFCGEDGCGIVINFQVDIPPLIALPVIEIERLVVFEDLVFRFEIIQWHPPQA